MKKSEKVEQLQEILKDLFIVVGIDPLNFRVNGEPGHPFTIGPEHVAYAHDHHNGIMDESVCEKIPCKARSLHPRFRKILVPGESKGGICNQPRSAHAHDTVVFLKLKRDTTKSEAGELMLKAEVFFKENDIDGFIFVETPEKFRIAEKETLV